MKVAKYYFHIVVTHIEVLCASVVLKRFVANFFEHLESLLRHFFTDPRFEMTVHKAKSCVCDPEPHRNSASTAIRSLEELCGCDVFDPVQKRLLRKQKCVHA